MFLHKYNSLSHNLWEKRSNSKTSSFKQMSYYIIIENSNLHVPYYDTRKQNKSMNAKLTKKKKKKDNCIDLLLQN